MDFLDFLGDVVTSGLGPSTPRGTMRVGIVIGLAIATALGWLMIVSDDPSRTPEWGYGVIVLGFIFPPAEVLLGLATMKREPENRGIALLNVLANAGVLVLVVLALT